LAGIVSFGTYLPRVRLSPATANWPHKTERTAANFDEDAITMAVAAARECLQGFDRATVDAIYVASTSLPYAEKQSASLIATAADLQRGILTVDIAHSLRGATQALRLALDAVVAGSARNVLVIATDCRLAAPGSDLERDGGDGAVALLVGSEGVVAEVGDSYTEVNDILDVWRADGSRLLQASPEEHFRHESGYLSAIGLAAQGFAAKTGQPVASFPTVALYAPDPRRHADAVKQLGLEAGKALAPARGAGSAGTACALIQLVQAFERSKPGEEFLLMNYGDGADATAVRAMDGLPALCRKRPTITAQLERGTAVADYYEFLGWRGLGIETAPPGTRMAPAPHALYRHQDEVIRFQGMRCTDCGMVQYPAQRVCVRCQKKDRSEPIHMADGGATLFSYSMDYVAATPDVPLVHGVVDFEVGGRAMMMLTDRDIATVQIGMKLDLAFRKFSQADGVHTYLWKAVPSAS
jgi:hydroxymethylglutaryl-CoA synthase